MAVIAAGGGAGGGGVTGLTSAAGGTALADNALVRGDGTTGIQGSTVTLSDTTGAFVQTTTNGSITLTPDGTGNVLIGRGQLLLQNGSMSAPALTLASAPTGAGIGNTPAGFGIIHAATVYTDIRASSLAVRSSSNGAQGGIAATLPSATAPNLCPDVIGDPTTGLGRAGAGILSIIAAANEILRAEFSGAAKKIGFLGKSTAPAVAQTGGAATAGATYDAATQAMIQAAYDCLRTFGLLT